MNNYVHKPSIDTDGLLILASAMMEPGGAGKAIEASEAAGQRQLVASDVLPTEGLDAAALTALGFTVGDRVTGDGLFTHVMLPAGWRKVGSDHNMWSYVQDEHGRRRISCFYKAAIYDRRAHMRIHTPLNYMGECLDEGNNPVLDDTWLTAGTALAVLDEIAAYESTQQDTWAQRIHAGLDQSRARTYEQFADEHEVRKQAAWALRDQIAGAVA